jgi:hypothetical protein
MNRFKEDLIKYDRLLACRGLSHTVAQDRRQANSLSYLIRATLVLNLHQSGFDRVAHQTGDVENL